MKLWMVYNTDFGFMIDYHLWHHALSNFGTSQILQKRALWTSLVLFSRGKLDSWGILGSCLTVHNWDDGWFQYGSMIFVVQATLWWWSPTTQFLACDNQVISWVRGQVIFWTDIDSCCSHELAVGQATRDLIISVWVKIWAGKRMFLYIELPSASPKAIERWPQGSLMCTLGSWPYTKWAAPSKGAPGTMYEPLAWQQTAAWKGTGWKRREVASREVDVHTEWKPERGRS